jgi:hypothetical protein
MRRIAFVRFVPSMTSMSTVAATRLVDKSKGIYGSQT